MARGMICRPAWPGGCGAGPSGVLAGAVSSVSAGQLEWQNGRTGRVGWQRAGLCVTGQCGAGLVWLRLVCRCRCRGAGWWR